MNLDLSHYRFGQADLVEGPRGQIANRILIENRKRIDPQSIELREDLYCLMGVNICNTQLVIGPDGVVVVDTGRSTADGEGILELLTRISNKPVVAVVYTHSHYTLGTQPILARYPKAEVIAHYKVHRNFVRSLTGHRRFMQRRGHMESARHLPESGPDADATGSRTFNPGSMGYVPPTLTIEKDGQELSLAGIPFVFYTRYPFDTNDTLLTWLPDQRAIIHNHFASNFPNIYPIQGGRYRDPEPWLDGIDKMRELRPEHILSTHGHPDSGENRCVERLTAIRDALQFVHDQTIRGMNKHLTPLELLDFVKLPGALRDHPDLHQTYGEVSNHVRGVFAGLAGWFDGDAASIQPPPPHVEATHVIDAFGGIDAGIKRLEEALERGEYSWAARIGQWLIATGTERSDVRDAQARALRKLGQVSTAWTVRNYYLSAARELEGLVNTRPTGRTVNTAAALQTEPGTFVRALGYRADPERFPREEKALAITFTDIDAPNNRFGLILRRGLAEFVAGAPPQASAEISCPRSTWIAYVDDSGAFSRIIEEDGVHSSPNTDDVIRLLSVFE